MKEIRIFIADDHPVFLSGLRMIIESEPSLKIIGDAANGAKALAQIQSLQPDVAVLDLNMPDKNAFEIVRALREENSRVKIIFLTMDDEEATLNSALDLGVKGYILKDSAVADIVNAIKAVAKGRNFITPKLSTYLVSRSQDTKGFAPKIENLTTTELKILRLIAEHKTTKEIASQLFVSPRTIDSHRYNICHKLNVRGINSLLKFSIENKSKFS